MRSLILAAALLSAALPAAAPAGGGHGEHRVEGPADAYVYRLAPPGSYRLPTIKPAGDALLLDGSGAGQRLSELLPDRVTVLAFLYTRCADACPLAALRLADLQLLASRMPEVAERLRLVSVSFDPEHDTPERMAEYGRQFWQPGAPRPEWLFLTAADRASLAPMLQAYGQPVAAKPDPDDPAGPYSHLLRVFLIDPQRRVRNIYSSDFLDPRLVLNDVLTLLAEQPPARQSAEGRP